MDAESQARFLKLKSMIENKPLNDVFNKTATAEHQMLLNNILDPSALEHPLSWQYASQDDPQGAMSAPDYMKAGGAYGAKMRDPGPITDVDRFMDERDQALETARKYRNEK